MPIYLTRKIVPQIYDADTALGINNSGILSFGYSLEDTDQTDAVTAGTGSAGQADVFNGQKSVLWNNLRECFKGDISNLYNTLRSQGTWTYNAFVELFENHQSKWSETIFNEDAWFKYVYPFIYALTEDEETHQLIKTPKYLQMLQGRKREQRKFWLMNRFRYMDSKFIAGEAASKFINIRLFHSGTMTITPAIDMYVSLRFGAGTTPEQRRTTANTPVTFTYDNSSVQEMETFIYSADLITDLGDLSVFYPNECDFKYCTRLRHIKVGDSAVGYSNGNLKQFTASNCVMLEDIDMRNSTALAQTINIENSTRLKAGYFEGTQIPAVILADGCPIQTLHLPASTTTLVLTNLSQLSDFQIPSYANVTTLILENMDQTVINPATVLAQMAPHSWVSITGLYMDFQSKADIDSFLALVGTMDGVSRSKDQEGNWIYTHLPNAPVLSGTIHTDTLTGAEIAAYRTNYPYLTFTADHVTAVITFKNADGSVTYETAVISNGGNASYSGQVTPTKASTAQYDYTFANSWSLQANGVSDPNALNSVWEDRTVYATFNATVRHYNVRYFNNSTQIGSTQSVAYGSNATPPADPVHWEDSERYVFTGWNPTGQNIAGATDCYAQYRDTKSKVLTFIDRTITEATDTEDYRVTKIGDNAFSGCSSLKSANFPAATSVGNYSFYYCFNLATIYLQNATNIGMYAFSTCSKLTALNLPSVTKIESYAFASCSKIESANFQAMTEIGSNGFVNCSSMENFYAPLLTKIGTSAFSNCSKLASIDLSLVTTIETSAFYGCKKLKSIYAPLMNNVPDTGFNGCTELESVNFPLATRINATAFQSCSSLTSVNVPQCTRIGSNAFTFCTSLSSVTFQNVTQLEFNAFAGCSNLEYADFGSLTSMSTGVFRNCTNLKTLILRYPYVVSIGSDTLTNVPASTLSVYVPDDYVDQYKNYTNWKPYSDCIKPLSTLPVQGGD